MRTSFYSLFTMMVLFLITISRGVADDAAPLCILPPAGWTAADSLRVYGTTDNPGSDGTIFDYMNGGGLVYLDHGLIRNYHRSCTNPQGALLTVDVFDLGTIEHAVEAFADENICPPEPITCNIDIPCNAYNYPPDFFLYARKGRFLLYVGTSSDAFRAELIEYTRYLASTIPGG